MLSTLRTSALLTLSTLCISGAPPTGKALYDAQCQACHGKDGAGTPAGPVLHGKLKHGSDQKSVAAVLKTGVPGTSMRAFSELSETQRQAIARYLVALNKPAAATK